MLTLKDFPLWASPQVAFILVEPTIMSEAQWQALIDDRMEKMQFSIRMTMKRRTLWPNREDAFAWFRRKYPGTTWDGRVLRAFVVRNSRGCFSGADVVYLFSIDQRIMVWKRRQKEFA